MSKKNAAIYNQAIMDFGATVCKPQLPLCASCPLQKKCGAFLNNKVSILPIKEKAIKKTQRWFYYIVAQYKNEVYIQERLQKDIWQNLHQFVLIEMPEKSSVQSVINSNAFKTVFGSIKYNVAENSKEYTQILSHQTIRGNF
ncbi:MAG: hypothetical protein IPP48_07820 [Chitinophagaceae bacterium]|nr:hypothetical protein [Chitinophagaceae bacterium]